MIRIFMVAFLSLVWTVRSVAAQDAVWIQVEAQPSLRSAQSRVQDYSEYLSDVNGFDLGAGWYGIALGPYTRADANRVLREYVRGGQIPPDSYIAFTRSYRSQFWPIGSTLLADLQGGGAAAPQPQPAQPAQQPQPAETNGEVVVQAEVEETPREAQRIESRLSRDEKKQLQIMLKWAGFYTAGIDGSFGRGTRGSMAAWQAANGFEATGILTTKQRAALLQQYNAVLEGMNLALVTDDRAGVRMQIPTGVVALDNYEYPFAHYGPKGDLKAQVLLISQEGTQDTLFGLYDILQTLEVVPLEGPRKRGRNGFELVGSNEQIISYTFARLDRGAVKGFMLVWPAGDEERRKRVLAEMQASFEPLPGALTLQDTQSEQQAVDLLSGLKIRTPRLSRSGFFTDGRGTVVTTSEVVDNCTRLTLDQENDATVMARDDTLGIAILKPANALSPRAAAQFTDAVPRLQSEVAVAGYSYEGALDGPSTTFGRLVDLRGLGGEDTMRRLALTTLPGDAGGPVMDAGGSVLGMLLAKSNSGRALPAEVSFAVPASYLQEMLASAGVPTGVARSTQAMHPLDLAARGGDMTVLVSCWD